MSTLVYMYLADFRAAASSATELPDCCGNTQAYNGDVPSEWLPSLPTDETQWPR